MSHILRHPLAQVIRLEPYLHRKKSQVKKFEAEPVTGVCEIVPLASDIPDRSRKLRQRNPGLDRLRTLLHEGRNARELRVMNMFVRCVLGAEGLESYVYAAGKNEDAWRRVLIQFDARMRRFTEHAERTGTCTRRGFEILHGKNPRGRHVFITRDKRDDRIVAFYTGTQWNHKRANRRDRAESHRLAMVHRRNKSRLSPR